MWIPVPFLAGEGLEIHGCDLMMGATGEIVGAEFLELGVFLCGEIAEAGTVAWGNEDPRAF